MKNIKKILALALVVVSVLAIAVPASAAYSTMYVDGGIGPGETVRLRSSMSTANNNNVLTNIPYGTAVSAEKVSGTSWHHVNWNGYSGYMLSSYLSTTPPAGLPWIAYYGQPDYGPSDTYKAGVAKVQTDLNTYFRTNNDTGYTWYPLVVDGRFGSNTTSAVRRFQTIKGLTVDGWVGNLTKKALYEEVH